VVTACALPATTAAQWKDRLCRVLGIASDITFNVDPELIAGAELHFPMAILRFSWQSALATARSAVGGHAQPG
jgi:F-type H+-transporting ATPase subunit b